jgi:RES domain-containing protein
LSEFPLFRVAGRFYRAIRDDHIDHVLSPPAPDNAGRYHRHGEPALYLTASPEWATIAVSKYMREDGLPRVIVPLDLDGADVLDQRDDAACIAAGIDPEASGADWRKALKAGEEPPSWHAADAARAIGAAGIIDVSRHIPGGWHVTLFRWNAPGAPRVKIVGEAVPVVLSERVDRGE